MNLKKILAFTLISVILVTSLQLKTMADISSNFTVSSSKIGSKQIGSLQYAITNAKDGDTIILENGIYDVTTDDNKGSFFVIKQNNITIKAKESNPNVIIKAKSSDHANYDGGSVSSQETILVLGNNASINGLTITPLLDMTSNPLILKNSIRVNDFKFTNLEPDFTSFQLTNCKLNSNELYPNYGGKVFLDISNSTDSSKILLTNNTFKKANIEIRTPATLNKNTFTGEIKEEASILIKNQVVENQYNIVLSNNIFKEIPSKQKAIDVNSLTKINLTDNKVNNTLISSSSDPFIENKANALLTFKNTVATVTFETNGGNTIEPQIIPMGTNVSLPTATKTGFVFKGWYTDIELKNVFDSSTAINSDQTLYAKWEEVVLDNTIVFNTNGGTLINNQTVASGNTVSEPIKPTKDGYDFSGWYLDANLTNPFAFSTIINSSITLYAKWDLKIPNFTVKFDSNGGTSIDDKVVKSGESIPAPSAPLKTDFLFANWYKDSSFIYRYDFASKVTENITLYAKWEPIPKSDVTITFNSNGGTNVSSKTVKYNEAVTKPTSPTKSGYTFVNWYTDNSLAYLYNFNTKVTSNITLYAKWQSVSNNTVTFNSNGGTSISSKTVKYNDTISPPTNPTKTGYSFDGWYTSSDLNYRYDFNTNITSNITLYAKWTQLSNYNVVSFVSNGGSERESISVRYGQSISQPTNPTRTGYVFDGWYKNSSLTQKYNFSDDVTQNITLYAKWVSERDVLVVDFRTNGGTSINSIQVNYNNRISQPHNPKKDNFSFEGWYTDYDLKNKFNFNTLIKEHTTLYAKWVSDVYTVNFDSRGGSYVAPKYPNYNEKISQPANPYLSGYRFLGWYKDYNLLNKFDFAQLITSNITLYAKWELNPVATPVPTPKPTPSPTAPTITYSDVPKTHWAYDAIYSLTRRGILEGQSVMKFVPEKELTRAEFASILTKAFQLTEKTGAKNYTDVKSTDWFYNYVKIVTSNNIYSGYDNGTFKPNKPINREEMSVVIYRVLGIKGFTINKIRNENVSDLYNATFGKEAITYLYQRGIVNGDNNKYMPAKNSTRAEASMVIYNLINILEK